MNNYKILSLTSAALAGTLLYTSSAQALEFSLNNHDSVNGIFSYDITLVPNESLSVDDTLALTNLAGVTAVNSTGNPNLQFTSNSFTATSADFALPTLVAAQANSQFFDNVITLTSNNPILTINYTADSSLGTFQSTAQGPGTAVPFEFSPTLGLLTIGGIFAITRLRKNL